MADQQMTMERAQQVLDTPVTASHILTVDLLSWIADEAKRLGVSKSEVVRKLIDRARAEQQEAA